MAVSTWLSKAGRWDPVLSTGVGRALVWKTLVAVDICGVKSCICRVNIDPQLGIIDHGRRCSSVKETQSSDHTS